MKLVPVGSRRQAERVSLLFHTAGALQKLAGPLPVLYLFVFACFSEASRG